MVQSGATPAKSHPQQQNVQKYVIDRDHPFFFILSHRGRRPRVKGKERSLLPSKDDLARVKRAKLSTMGNNTDYLSIQIIWALTKSSDLYVRPSVRPPLHASGFRMPYLLA